MQITRRLTLSFALLGLVHCQSRPGGDSAPPDVSNLSSDNGSWGNGSWGNGTWGNGSWGNGTWGNGSWGNGTWGNGSWGNGTWGNGTWGNGTWGNGSWGNGTWGNGTWGNGTWGNGSWGNGTWGNGSWGNGMILSTLSVGSLDISALVDVSLSSGTCAAPDRAAAMTELMVYMATIQCALPNPCVGQGPECISQIDCAAEQNCKVLTDCDGNEIYVLGRDGIGTDQNDPAVVAAVDACIDVTLTQLNNEFRAYADNLNRYAVSCALPPSSGGDCSSDPGCTEVTYQLYPSGTETKQYYGAIGLAPTWKSNPNYDLDPLGQRRVSACLASRTNADRKKVQISIRGLGIPTTATERQIYRQHEGAFWGNRFDSAAVINVCTVDGGGISGRLCADGSCGFVDHGDCATACSSMDSEGNYTHCGSESDTEVINTFLPFSRRLSGGFDHRCAVRKDGTTWCWGKNYQGQLGLGTSGNYHIGAQEVTALGNDVVEFAAGTQHTCARRSDGSLWCFGRNGYGRLGNGTLVDSSLPIHVDTLGYDVAQVSAERDQVCAVKTDGTVWCWGSDQYDSLGVDSQTCVHSWGSYPCSPTPQQVDGLSDVVKVGTGKHYSCALKYDGSVWCWGANGQGKLGTGNYSPQPSPVQNALPVQAMDIAMGAKHACAIDIVGDVWCWGENDYGAVGDNQVNDDHKGNVPAPVKVLGLPLPATQIDLGISHSCVVLADDSFWCWGQNLLGQIGVGDEVNRHAPVPVSLPGPVSTMLVTDTQTQVLLQDGSIYVFGSNGLHQLGVVTTETCVGLTSPVTCSTTPIRMTVLDNCGDGVCDVGESAGSCAADCAP